MAEVLDRGAGKGLLTHRHTLIGGLPPISRRPVRFATPKAANLTCRHVRPTLTGPLTLLGSAFLRSASLLRALLGRRLGGALLGGALLGGALLRPPLLRGRALGALLGKQLGGAFQRHAVLVVVLAQGGVVLTVGDIGAEPATLHHDRLLGVRVLPQLT